MKIKDIKNEREVRTMRGIVIYKDEDYRVCKVEQVFTLHGIEITSIFADKEIYKAVNRAWEKSISKVTYDEKTTFNYVPVGVLKIIAGCGWLVIYRESEDK